MFKHILIATDGSERSERAIALGVGVAKSMGAKVTALMTSWPVPLVFVETAGDAVANEELEQNARDYAKRCLAVAENAAKEAGIECEAVHLFEMRPFEAIVRTAENSGCDVIVMASHGRSGASALLLGSETQKVLATTKLPVLICR